MGDKDGGRMGRKEEEGAWIIFKTFKSVSKDFTFVKAPMIV